MENEKVDSMFMENLEEWILEEEKVVTYKYLSKALKCHVNVSKQMLYNFVDEQKKKDNTELGVVYLVSGTLKAESGVSKLKVVLVEAKDLSKEEEKFDKVLSKHIYSVQKSKRITSTAVFAADRVNHIDEKNNDEININPHCAIKNKAGVPSRLPTNIPVSKPEVKKEIKKEIKKEVKKEETKQDTKPNNIQAAFSKAKTKKSPEKEDSGKKPPSGKKPATSNIASMFAKQAAKPPKKKEELTSESSPGKENMENVQIEVKKEEEKKAKEAEKTSPSSTKTSASKKSASAGKKSTKKSKNSAKGESSKKRKRIQVASDSESDGDDDEESVERVADAMSEDEAPPQTRIIESDEEEEIPSTPQQNETTRTGRRRVRKEVEKTYMDDKGYMVTKKEFEYVSEDEPEEPEAKPEPVKPAAAAKTVPAPAAKKQKLMAGNTKQPGIMSFFKKK